jgi:hypothetical protein
MNYAQLSTAIQDYAETFEQVFIDNIPNFVQLAEERVYNAVQLPAIRRNVMGNFTAGDKYLSLPTDYLAAFSVAVTDLNGDQQFLLDKDVNFIRQAYPSPSDTGLPKYFGQFAPYTFIIGPTPDQNYVVELHEYYYPESIVTAGTTWLGDNFETVLLYGSLREAVIFQKGEQDMVAYYEKMYQESMALLKELGDGKERRSAYRDGQLKLPVPGPVR